MGLCGDAVKIEKKQLERLLEVQELLLANKKLEIRAAGVKEALLHDDLREQMLAVSSELSSKLSRHEEIARDLGRLKDEVLLVQKRIDQDNARLKTTAVARDAIGLQSELETLNKRLSSLNEQIELVELESEASQEEQAALQVQRDELEEASQIERERAKQELEGLKVEHRANASAALEIQAQVDAELLAVFQARAARGLAVGRLRSNSCGACNMSLNAAAMANISAMPADELVSCPECQAILIR